MKDQCSFQILQYKSCPAKYSAPKTSIQAKGSQDSQHPAEDRADTIESSARTQNLAVIQFAVGYG